VEPSARRDSISADIDRRVLTRAVVLAAMLVAAVTAIALGAVPDRRDDIWVDLARAGIQLVVIIGLGGVVSLVLKDAEAARDRRRLLDERRYATFEQLVTMYNRLKFVRRNLRMVGLRSHPDALRAEQVEALRTAQQTITEVQLTLEEVLRGLDARPIFDKAKEIHERLGILTIYVDKLVDEWERQGKHFWVDQQTRKVGDLPRLQKFLGPAKDDFRPNAAEPLGWVEWIIREQLIEGKMALLTSRAQHSNRAQAPARAPDPFAQFDD
jgi:hypothetical protein